MIAPGLAGDPAVGHGPPSAAVIRNPATVADAPTPAPAPPRLPALRRLLRTARRQLRARTQRHHARALARLLAKEPRLRLARRIAAYAPADGELDPRPLLARTQARGRRCYLPVLRPGRERRLWFVRHRPGRALATNRLGIPEPRPGRTGRQPPWALDLLLVPLVGFDPDCNRLGMGGGYYDRTLAFLRQRRHWRRPYLIGLAHECQRVERLVPRPWDVPLDAVATEKRLYLRNQTRSRSRGVGSLSLSYS